jgi:hypothetical protein
MHRPNRILLPMPTTIQRHPDVLRETNAMENTSFRSAIVGSDLDPQVSSEVAEACRQFAVG